MTDGDGVPTAFHVTDVGRFVLETSQSGSFRYWICHHPRRDAGVIRVLLYPENGSVDDARRERVRRATRHIVDNTAAMLATKQADLARMLDSYEIDEPASYDDLFRALELQLVKFVTNDSIEIVFDECPAIGGFNLVALVDDQMRIGEIWFDG